MNAILAEHPGYLFIFVGGLIIIAAALRQRRKNNAEADRLKKIIKDFEDRKPPL